MIVMLAVKNTINGASPASMQMSFKPASQNRYPKFDKALQNSMECSHPKNYFRAEFFLLPDQRYVLCGFLKSRYPVYRCRLLNTLARLNCQIPAPQFYGISDQSYYVVF